MRIPLQQGRRSLAIIWLVCGGILFGYLVLQTVLNHFGDRTEEVWSWLLPTVLPSMSLIVAALFVSRHSERATVDRFAFRVAFAMSLAYLLVVILIVVVQPPTQPLRLICLSVQMSS